jgi:hypothetical protein
LVAGEDATTVADTNMKSSCEIISVDSVAGSDLSPPQTSDDENAG